MMKIFVYAISCLFAFNSCKKSDTIPIVTPAESQIIANHTVVADFDKIPAQYISEVKKMMVCFAGESHSSAYRKGMELLEALQPAYACNVSTGEAYTDQYLRVNAGAWTGEDTWYTWYGYPLATRPASSNTIKNTIKEYADHGHPLHAIGFGWCWDMVATNVSSTRDPVYGCHWYGASYGGPEGTKAWGLDAGDYSITGNSVSMDTYLSATEDYIAFCTANGYDTKVVFTTGPVDPECIGEAGYQAYVKHQYIRNYVSAKSTRILFDYADILSYDDNGTQTTISWNGHTFPYITTTNLGDANVGHIGSAGAIRLAKAQWWLLARIAGWNGVITTIVPVTGITVTGSGGVTTILTDNGTLQLSSAMSPSNATNKTVTWSISNGTGQASISASGIVTAISNGTVTAKATANDGSGVSGSLVITISNQVNVVYVTGITVTGSGGATTINTDNGTLQLSAAITPTDATNKTVTWNISNGTGQASISASGLVTAIASGAVTAKANANDGSGVSGTQVITISNQLVQVKGILVTGSKGNNSITTDDGTLQLSATITPMDATNQTVSWSIINETGQASINSLGIVTGISNGTVTAQALANDGSGVYGSLVITISNQNTLITSINISSEGGITSIDTENGTLQLYATITPNYATSQAVIWNISNGTGQASISATGLVTAIASGTVIARATANDGSEANGEIEITIRRRNTELLTVIVDQNEMRFPLDESYLKCKISLYDLNGNLMRAMLVDSNICVFDISVFRPGMYLAVLSNNMILKVAKVILP